MFNAISVTARVVSGFVAVGIVLVFFAVFAFQTVSSVGEYFHTYRNTAEVTNALTDYAEDLFEARIAALRFVEDPSAGHAEVVRSNISEITIAAQDVSVFGDDVDTAEAVRQHAVNAAEFLSVFGELEELTLSADMLLGQVLDQSLNTYTLAARLADDARLSRKAFVRHKTEEVMTGLTEVQDQYRAFEQRGEAENLTQAQSVFASIATTVEQAKSLPMADNQRDMLNALQSEIGELAAKTEQLSELSARSTEIAKVELNRIGMDLETRYEVLIDAARAQLAETGPKAVSAVNDAIALKPVVAALSVLSAIAAALIVGRWITKPLRRLARTTRDLADGNTDIEIAGAEHKHELGQMAQALVVFRQAHIDRDREVKESARQARAEQESVVCALQTGLNALAAGDLRHRLEDAFPPDYEQLRLDFNEAVERLQTTIQTVVDAALSIRQSAQEITASSDDLTRRTESQAATLEETAAAVEEMAANVKSTSDGAAQANRHMADASRSATDGNAVVKQTIAAMDEIQSSSTQISQIIKVIDDIAFQTNLLALNAGVEAARAGESGRGFAVVASEVRGLAQRSSTAANEIKDLIETSADTVAKGAGLVQKTGAALEDIVGLVHQVSGLVSEIDAGTNEQTTGVDEINSAVAQLDQVTQQNAAMAEETHAACAVLSKEAGDLETLTSHFKTASRHAVHNMNDAA